MLMETAFRHVSLQRYDRNVDQPHPLIAQTDQGLSRVLQRLVITDLPDGGAAASPDAANLQLAVALDYLHFRRPDLLTAALAPALHDRLARYQARPSFSRTTPMALAVQPQRILTQ
jgi:glutathione S-transferase